MSATTFDAALDSRRMRLDTLINLRWLAVAGQTVAVVVVHFGFGFPVPIGPCFLLIALSAWLNIGLRIRFPTSRRLPHREAAAMLAFDIIQLGALLYFTGGLKNPFALLILAPVMISATALPPWQTLGLGILAVLVSTFLAFRHWPLPWIPGETLDWPLTYIAGVWAAVQLGLAFTGVYAWRVAQEARELAEALAATELVLAREQHLSQLDGLAAAAAHELGTPLATIALVAKELDKPQTDEKAYREDVKLLCEQVARCREILGTLKALGAERQEPIDTLRLAHLIEEVVEPLRGGEVEIVVARGGEGPEPACRRNPGVIYGMENLVENAVDFAERRVEIAARWTASAVEIVIRDDGPGFAQDVLMRLGEPYLTSRTDSRRIKGGEGGGLGLGLFIAKTLIERSGATLVMANAKPPAKGAVVTVTWPRGAFERGVGREALPVIPGRREASSPEPMNTRGRV
jgi:two-component system sensor histidine kinase RegB